MWQDDRHRSADGYARGNGLRCLREKERKVTFIPEIIFENEAILVLEKPAGLVVNRAKSVKGETLQDWIEKQPSYQAIKQSGRGRSDFIRRSGVVHRLDKETSGLLVVAKTQKAFENLQNQFKERRVKKRYLALVHGKVTPVKGEISVSISRHPYARKKFGVFLDGRPAKTRYEVKKNYTLDAKHYTLLELTPETGRPHQIRVHLKHIGYPVVGDAKYAGRKTARADRKWCPRQFLHAYYLSFTHPETGEKVEFFSKLPRDLAQSLKGMVK